MVFWSQRSITSGGGVPAMGCGRGLTVRDRALSSKFRLSVGHRLLKCQPLHTAWISVAALCLVSIRSISNCCLAPSLLKNKNINSRIKHWNCNKTNYAVYCSISNCCLAHSLLNNRNKNIINKKRIKHFRIVIKLITLYILVKMGRYTLIFQKYSYWKKGSFKRL